MFVAEEASLFSTSRKIRASVVFLPGNMTGPVAPNSTTVAANVAGEPYIDGFADEQTLTHG